jgi:hypothetical protein
VANSLTFEELYADLVAANTETLPDDYITLAKFRRDTGLTERIATKRLTERVEAGQMQTRLALVDGRRVRIWWFTGEAE